jgi:putative ABC transport system permease protein
MSLITGEDESYWDTWKSTPKAIIPYQAVAQQWSNSFGSATALRIPPLSLTVLQSYDLTVSMFGIQLSHPREMALQAARSGVDFSGLFFSLGFFIILSAIVLMLVPLSEMLFHRKDETVLLHSLGYTTKRIIRLFRLESFPVVLKSSVGGIVSGMIYTWLVLFLLGTVWKGATNTEGFMIYPNFPAIIICFLTGLLLFVRLLLTFLRRSLKKTIRNKNRKPLSSHKKLILTITVSLLLLLIIFYSLVFAPTVELFIIAGITFIGATALWGDYLICREGALMNKPFTETHILWKSLFFGRKQAVLSFFPLAMGVFIVFSVGLNRQGFADNSQIITGTGGYSLWCESSVPVYHNLSTQWGREKLALTELPADAEVLQLFRYGADDASCLNLNKVSNPTVLGVDIDQLSRSRFRINRTFDRNEVENSFESFRMRTDSVYPCLIDETVLTWGLGLNLGDTIVYQGSNGKRAVLQLAGTLHNSIFQGNILIDRNLFSEIWDEIAGSEVMLVKVNEDAKESVKMLLSRALNEYGIRVMTTNDRLKMFNSVTDTYLTIFMMLGSIGLLLGIMSFIIVIRKNLASRQQEIHVYRSLGFPDRKIARFLRMENNAVPLYAIGTGVAGAFLAAGGGLANVSVWILLTSILFATLFVGCILVFVRRIVNKIIK